MTVSGVGEDGTRPRFSAGRADDGPGGALRLPSRRQGGVGAIGGAAAAGTRVVHASMEQSEVRAPRHSRLLLYVTCADQWSFDRFECDDTVPLGQSGPLPILTVMVKGGLRGGKGGFGAMLRSMGKGAGSKQTTDFGACRDLYGRRLRCAAVTLADGRFWVSAFMLTCHACLFRHVNDEIRLKKWLEDKEREEQDKGASHVAHACRLKWCGCADARRFVVGVCLLKIGSATRARWRSSRRRLRAASRGGTSGETAAPMSS